VYKAFSVLASVLLFVKSAPGVGRTARRRADQQGKYFTIVKYGDLMTTSPPPSASASTSPDQTWDDLLHMVSTGRRPRPGA
jgi:hypothetical protein